MRFDEIEFTPELLDGLDAMNFQEMTPIQEQSMPEILKGNDLIACAQTGTGKTAAYLLPLINRLLKDTSGDDKVRAIVMAPTRELAQQIDQQLEGFSYFVSVSSVAVYGGNDASAWSTQKQAMQNGTDIVIATPGRLISHIKMDNVDFSGVKYFILDEADRMLDMGFYDDIIQIVKKLPVERQTIMFSATMPDKIKKLANNILRNPSFVNVAISKPAEGIEQSAYVCYEPQKLGLIKYLVKEKSQDKTIIFSSKKQKVKDIYHTLMRQGVKCGCMHADLEQNEREEVMLDYKSGKINVLVATDIVARGIDIEGIDLVVNYDVPHDAEDYIHRIGRTARANREGAGVTFVSPEDQDKFYMIEKFLDKEITKAQVPEQLGETPEYAPRRANGGNKGNRRNGRNNNRRRPDNRPKQENKSEQASKENADGQNNEHKRPRNNHRRPFHKRKPKANTDDAQG